MAFQECLIALTVHIRSEKNYPDAWRAQFTRDDHGVPTIILEYRQGRMWSGRLWVLKQKWHIIKQLARAWNREKLTKVLIACVILYNMEIEEDVRAICMYIPDYILNPPTKCSVADVAYRWQHFSSGLVVTIPLSLMLKYN
uniref:Uncharacterized protein n=1 Tax=Lactuca sativa TaxID=4236 RepID=A0A9R1XM20_LACSA|nr:hypothetical protein LSAT_V11C300130980 [Lactuca sativa]